MKRNLYISAFIILYNCINAQVNSITLRYRIDDKIVKMKGFTLTIKNVDGLNHKICSNDSLISVPIIDKKSLLDIVIQIGRKKYAFNNVSTEKLNGIWELDIDKKPFNKESRVNADLKKQIIEINKLSFINNEGDNTDLTKIVYKK